MSNETPLGVSLSEDRRRVTLRWREERVTTAPAPWLFDSAEDAFHPESGHRLRGALGAPQSIIGARLEGARLVVTFPPDGEERRIPLSLLAPDHAVPPAFARELWATPAWLADTPAIDLQDYLADDDAAATVLGRVARRGIAFLRGAGSDPDAVERVVARFGYIRETNYGRLFDVRDDPAAGHLAYTAVGLELHTDNPYRDPVPTLQLLHVIQSADDGGESQFVDGFAHAEAFRAASPDRFEVLAATPVEFGYRGPSGERYAARAPVIETTVDEEVAGIRINHRALSTVGMASGILEAWYEAYLDLYRRLHAPAARIERRLGPGEMVIFDNRRLLHGRSAYRSDGVSGRWLRGCYAERDGLMATLNRLSQRTG